MYGLIIFKGDGKVEDDIKRIKLTQFLQWNDRNGCYTDENCDLEDIPRMSYKEIIKYAKYNNFYETTYEKLNLVINNDKPTIEF
ncbi:hypothetical protein [Clostridium culturomicium]|uniref:hypothetical protein n=1 Tax=Clostridium culturomicium TaxID=1499683 RepID=UPI000B06782D|nr:hypothetical protein [Clostridium culturomicium]